MINSPVFGLPAFLEDSQHFSAFSGSTVWIKNTVHLFIPRRHYRVRGKLRDALREIVNVGRTTAARREDARQPTENGWLKTENAAHTWRRWTWTTIVRGGWREGEQLFDRPRARLFTYYVCVLKCSACLGQPADANRRRRMEQGKAEAAILAVCPFATREWVSRRDTHTRTRASGQRVTRKDYSLSMEGWRWRRRGRWPVKRVFGGHVVGSTLSY